MAVTYHYIRAENSDGVTGVTPGGFREQVEWIARRYTIVSAQEYAVRSSDPAPLALITFDDALRDQYHYAAPILEDLGVRGIFYAPMRPFSDEADGWCPQHLLHALAERLGWSQTERRVENLLTGPPAVDEARMNTLYHYEVPRKRRLKYLMAFAMSSVEAARILRTINADVGLNHRDWFMSSHELRDLHRRGHEIGAHGFDHAPYSAMSADEQRRDMRLADQWLRSVVGEPPRSIAFPFGRHDAVTDALVSAFGYRPAFTTENRVDAADLPAMMREAQEQRITA